MTRDEGVDFVLRNARTRLVVVGGFYPPGPDWNHRVDVERIISIGMYRSVNLGDDRIHFHHGRAVCCIPCLTKGEVLSYEPFENHNGGALGFLPEGDFRINVNNDLGCLPRDRGGRDGDFPIKIVNLYRATSNACDAFRFDYKELPPYNFDMSQALVRVAEQLRVKRNRAIPDVVRLIDEMIKGLNLILSEGQDQLKSHLVGLLDL